MKRAIAWLLTLALLISAFPAAAFAAEEPSVTPDAGDVTVEGTNSFGTLLSEDITEEEAAAEEAAADYEGGYSVTDLEIAGSTAVVTYDTLEEALLVVSLYTEDGLQMLLSANTTVTADATEATVTFEGDMPQYFLASAYLLDVYDLSPLCAAYDTPIYTQEMQELLASTVEDYDEALVLQLDEDETTNFAVYQDTTKIIEYTEGVNTVASIDDTTMTYVIENADEQFTTLVAGDIFAYAYSDSDILIARVSAITVDGTTVTITGEDLEMEDVFSHVKIEADGNTADMTVDESTAEEGITYAGLVAEDEEEVSPAAQTYSRAAEGGATATVSFKFNIDKTFTSDKDGVSGSSAKVTFEGALKFNVKFDFSYYVSTSKRYVKFLVDAGVSLSASVSGELKAQLLRLPSLGVSPVPGVYIGLEPHVEFQFSAKLELNCTYSFKIGFSYDNKSGATNLGSAPKVTSKVNFEGSIFLGVDLNPHIKLIGGAVADISLKGLVGIEFEGEMTGTVFEEEDFSNAPKECIHGCYRCLSGSIHAKIELGLTLEFLKCSFLTVDVNLFTGKYKIADLYYSFDNTEFGWGNCPHKVYRVTIVAKLLDYLPDVTICTADKAGTLTELGVTDQNGILLAYLPKGTYSFVAKLSDTQSLSKKQTVDQACKVQLDNTTIAKSYTYMMGAVESADGGNIVDSGTCGDNVKWTLTENGLLTISGTGDMEAYDTKGAPWYGQTVTNLLITNGITSIGSNAFYGCADLSSATIPEGVTSIQYRAFYNCIGLTSVLMPGSLVSIGQDAFRNCSALKSITIPASVSSIGDFTFGQCNNLAEVIIAKDNPNYCNDEAGVVYSKDMTTLVFAAPKGVSGEYIIHDTVTTIGNNAFNGCTALTSIVIPTGVSVIGAYAFRKCGLTTVNIPKTVISIGASAFRECTRLLHVVVPEGVTAIENGTFENCEALQSIVLPESVTQIADYAFYFCYALTDINIPSGISSIGNYVFSDCTHLARITLPEGVTSIGRYAFSKCYALKELILPKNVTQIAWRAFYFCNGSTVIRFCGNAPSIDAAAFFGATVDAYYPASNPSWTSDVMQDYGGTIAWVPYTLDENGEMVTGEATVTAAAAIKEESALAESPTVEVSDVVLTGEQTATVAGTLVLDKIGGENPGNTVNPDAVYGGDYTTEVTDSYTLKSASFTGLVPGQQYVLLAMVSTEVENPLAPDNLLYIDQAEALEDGTLSFRYVQRVNTDISYVVACGASNKDLADAQISFPEMESDIQNQVVSPTVVYDGVTLTEGQDYVVVGTVSFTEEGTYTCYIRGIRNYTGLVECSYTVAEAPVICAGLSLSLNGAIGVNFYTILRDDIVADENTRMVFNVGGKAYEMALADALADTQDDGSVWYRFSCSVPAKGMNDTISAQIYGTDGAVGKVMTYSVAAYYDDICQEFDREEKAELFALIEAMLNYGAASQEYFSYNTESLANAAVTTAVPETVDASAFANAVTDTDKLLDYAGMSLVLESNTVLRVFFRPTAGADISGYTFTVDGQTVTPVQRGNLWYVELSNIAAKELDEGHTFTAGDVTVEASALSYVNTVLGKADTMDAELVAVCKTLYAYNEAANAYFAATN